jgi:DNA topoisomerase-1
VKDLPKSQLGVDIEQDFSPRYEIIYGKAKVLKQIKDAAKNADVIYLAPDPDREGEAIAWHIAEEMGIKQKERICRVMFHEITKKAVLHAIAHPQPLDIHKYNSQQARRILDRLVGYQISPILWDKVRRGLSAGRVQSVAVRLVTEREHAIRAFVAEEYWRVKGLLHKANDSQTPPVSFPAEVVKHKGKKFRPDNQQDAQQCVDHIQQHTLNITKITQKRRHRHPNPPLITSRLQQEASSRLRFTAKRTMLVAQQLYEGVELGTEGQVGLITYMRTDSTRTSPTAIDAARNYIQIHYGPALLPEKPNIFKSKKNIQDAHEAIRPTSMEYPPQTVKPFLSSEQFRLYQLIWQIFIASQMQDAIYAQTSVDIAAGDYQLRTHGSILKEPGFLLAFADLPESDETSENNAEENTAEDAFSNKDRLLPELKEQQQLHCQTLKAEQHFTQPPPRFTESSLVKELEEKGIGRPSTYATILSTIVSRGYVVKQENKFVPTELGLLTTDLLVDSFPQILDVAFTADMESQLDHVETGQADWVALLRQFYHGSFDQALEKAKVHMRNVKEEAVPTEHACKVCGNVMFIKWGKNGSFLACGNYPKCRHTQDFVREPNGNIALVPEKTTSEPCPVCQGLMVVKRGRYGEFLACAQYPECKGTRALPIGVKCPTDNCQGDVVERRSKRGRMFYGCSRYPGCNFVSWYRPVDKACPVCGSTYLLCKSTKAQGMLWRCPQKECGYSRDPELES